MPAQSNNDDKNTNNLSESEIEEGIKVMELQNLVLKRILKEKGIPVASVKAKSKNDQIGVIPKIQGKQKSKEQLPKS